MKAPAHHTSSCLSISRSLVLVFFLLLGSKAMAQVPLLSYNFNEGKGTSTESSGSISGAAATLEVSPTPPDGNLIPTNLFGATGSGLSGAAGDTALNLSGATGMGTAGNTSSSGVAYLPNGGALVGGLSSFTITGWFKTEIVPCKSARLVTLTSGKTGFLLSFPEAGTVCLGINGTNVEAVNGYTQTNVWTFFAISYNGLATTDNVSFYVGTIGGKLNLLMTESSSIGTMIASTAPLTIGNNEPGIAPFKGLLDNIEVYGAATDSSGALNQSQITAIFEKVRKESTSVSDDHLK